MKDISRMKKVSKLMSEDQFWKLVEESKINSSSNKEQKEYLIFELTKLPLEDIIGFRLRTDKFLYDSYLSEWWCAAHILKHGCSDDSFEYFRNWVISRGKEIYYATKSNPDSLVKEIINIDGYSSYSFESFWYVGLIAFEKLTGKRLYEFVDEEKFITCEGNYPEINFNWDEKEPETMRKICPKLYNALWEKKKQNVNKSGL